MDHTNTAAESRLKVAFLSLPGRTHAALQAYMEGAGRPLFRIVDEDEADAAVFDFDHPVSRAHWAQFSASRGRPGILLSIAEQQEPDTVWVAKPVTGEALGRAATVLRPRQDAPRPAGAGAMGRDTTAPRPIRVAILSPAPRTRAALEVFFDGAGRSVFVLTEEHEAEAAICDFDHPVSRAHWEQFSARYGLPGILCSVLEQTVPNTVWVRKPMSGADLVAAAASLQPRGAAMTIPVMDAPAPVAETPAPVLETPAPVMEAAATVAEAAPPAQAAEPGNEAASAHATTLAAAAEAPSATTAAQPPVGAGLPVNEPADIANEPAATVPDGAAHGEAAPRKSATAIPMALAALLVIVAILWLWKGGRGPAADAPPAQAGSAPAAEAAGAPTREAGGRLGAAVAAAVAAQRTPSAADERFVRAQMDEINKRGTADDEEVKARLDRLAADPKALEAYYRSVYNKVHVGGNGASGAGAGRTPERDLRSRIDALVGNAVAAPQAAATGGFVSSLRPEAQEREAQMRTIAVQPGDTLGIIAKRAYGDASQYMKIFEANPRVLSSPHHIFPGQILRVPAG